MGEVWIRYRYRLFRFDVRFSLLRIVLMVVVMMMVMPTGMFVLVFAVLVVVVVVMVPVLRFVFVEIMIALASFLVVAIDIMTGAIAVVAFVVRLIVLVLIDTIRGVGRRGVRVGMSEVGGGGGGKLISFQLQPRGPVTTFSRHHIPRSETGKTALTHSFHMYTPRHHPAQPLPSPCQYR